MHIPFATLTLACAGFCFAVAVPAAAATVDEDIETVVVTAHRIPTPEPILPVTMVELEHHAAVGVELLRRIPNFAISQSGSQGGLTQVRVRGSEANHTLVLIDGVEANDPATGSEYNFAHLLPFASSHVEFLPGAQSALWGSDALAGVINVATIPTSRTRALSLEAGSFESHTLGLQLADRGERSYYNVAALDHSSDGTNISRTGSEEDGYEHTSLHLGGGWSQDAWRFSGLLRETRTESDFDPLSFATFRPVDGNNEGEHDELLVNANVEHVGERWLHQLKVSYLETENLAFADGVRQSRTEGERRKATYNAGVDLTDARRLQLLLEYEEEAFDQAGAASPFGDPNQRQEIDTTSAGIEYRDALGRLDWSASARFDDNSDFDDVTSYRLALQWRLTAAASIWANVGTGIKNPSFVERFGFTPNTFIGNPALEPEVNRHVSVGYAGAFEIGDTRAELRVALFSDRLDDEIDGFFFDPVNFAFTAVNQAGTSKRDGAEVTFAAVRGNTELEFSWGFVDAEEDDGQTEIRRPRHVGSLGVTHQRGRWTAHAGASYVDDQEDLDFATFPATRVTLDAYTLLRAHVSFALTERLDIALRLENLLDEEYEDLLGFQAPGRAGYLRMRLSL